MRLTLTAALAAVFLCLPAAAQEACIDPPGAIQAITAADPQAHVAYDINGGELIVFLNRYNAIPPETTYTAERALIFASPRFPDEYYMVLFLDGCLRWRGPDSVDLIQGLLGESL